MPEAGALAVGQTSAGALEVEVEEEPAPDVPCGEVGESA
jgi:hypothetical protein